MKAKNTYNPTPGLPPGKVKPPKLDSPMHSPSETNESGAVPANPEIKEEQQSNDQVIAPDGSPEPKQDSLPLY